MQTQWLEIYMAGLKGAADMMSATCESVSRIQRQQLDTLQSAMAEQAQLAGSQIERTVELWGRLWRAAGDNQLAIIGQAQAQVDQIGEGLREVARESPPEQRAA